MSKPLEEVAGTGWMSGVLLGVEVGVTVGVGVGNATQAQSIPVSVHTVIGGQVPPAQEGKSPHGIG